MARRGKIDRELGFGKKEVRPKAFRSERKFFLIVCEGEKTEPNYFKGLSQFIPRGTVELVLDIHGTGRNTLSLLEKIKAIRKNKEAEYDRTYDETWAVFDKDDFPDEHFNRAILIGRNERAPIFCAWSNEAFELWFLLHFNNYPEPMGRKQYAKLLEREISQLMSGPFKYEKNNAAMYTLLKTLGDESKAIERAKTLHQQYEDENFATHNPCTLVYQLVEKLLELSSF